MISIPADAAADSAGETSHLPPAGDNCPETPDALENAILSRLEPEGISSGGGWQQRKSARTRIAILEAAIKCLAEKGYARTTTKIVASMADVSRGAMLHHYPTKKRLIEQTIAYTFFKRLERTFRELRKLTEDERRGEMAGVRLYSKGQDTLEYRASLELCMAARSNGTLREILEPKVAQFEEILHSELPKTFPEWANIPAQVTLATDFVFAALDGLLINGVKWRGSERAENVRKLVGRIVFLLQTEAVKVEDL